MTIAYYCRQLSKRYLLSHLLLGVIAAGFGLTDASRQMTTLGLNTPQPVSIMAITTLAIGAYQEYQLDNQREAQTYPVKVTLSHSLDFAIGSRYYSPFTIFSPQSDYSKSHYIRAGPVFSLV